MPTELLIPEPDVEIFSAAEQMAARQEADALSSDVRTLLDAIRTHEVRLATSYAKLGRILLRIQKCDYWRTWGFTSWGGYIDSIRTEIDRGRSHIYAVIAVAQNLLPSVSEADLEHMGISRAQELSRFVKQSGQRVPKDLLEKALDNTLSVAELHTAVLEALHEKQDPKGIWFDFGGMYLLPDEKQEILQAVDLAELVAPAVDANLPDHVRRKEVLLRFAQEFYASHIQEAQQQ